MFLNLRSFVWLAGGLQGTLHLRYLTILTVPQIGARLHLSKPVCAARDDAVQLQIDSLVLSAKVPPGECGNLRRFKLCSQGLVGFDDEWSHSEFLIIICQLTHN